MGLGKHILPLKNLLLLPRGFLADRWGLNLIDHFAIGS
jgi:hypothetical protein